MNQAANQITLPFITAWAIIVAYLPKIIGAIIVFVIGLIIASLIARAINYLLKKARFNDLFGHVAPRFETAGFRFDPAYFISRIVYWFILIIFILGVTDSLGLTTLSTFIQNILYYIPNVVVAVLMLLGALALARAARRLIEGALVAGRESPVESTVLGSVAYWAIVIFGFLAALEQLRITPSLINILVSGFVGMLALAGGLAFGLGGRNQASEVIDRMRERVKQRKI
jgi:hypothetical protein